MNKTFTVNAASGSVSVEATTRVEAIEKTKHLVKDLYVVQGPRFTDSYRTKPKAGKAAKRNTPKEAAQEVHYFGNRAAVRALTHL